MKSLCLHSLVILLLQSHVTSQEPCGERNVVGPVGRAVTLQVPHTKFKNIGWSFGEKGDSLATIVPGEEIKLQHSRYDRRLSSSSDGSLTITNLTHEDQGTYRAEIFTDVKRSCFYHLSVYNGKSQGPCGERNVVGVVGGAVTLRVSDPEFDNIAWRFSEKGDSLATIVPGAPIIIQDPRYEGRLITSSDGSLTITNLQHEDQGTYRAKSRNLDCPYHLSVFSDTSGKTNTQQTLIYIMLAVVILMSIVVFWIVQKKISRSSCVNKAKIPSTNESNAYEFNDEEDAACAEAQGDEVQKPGKARYMQSNFKGQQEIVVCVIANASGEVRPLQSLVWK